MTVEKREFILSLLPPDIRLAEVRESLLAGKPLLILARKTRYGEVVHGAEFARDISDEKLKGLVEDVVFLLRHREIGEGGEVRRIEPQTSEDVSRKIDEFLANAK